MNNQQKENNNLKTQIKKYDSISDNIEFKKYLEEYSNLKKIYEDKQWMLENMNKK